MKLSRIKKSGTGSHFSVVVLAMAVMILQPVQADDYIIDNGGAHSTIQFKISHLGYSWLWGRFNNFEGAFSYDSSDLSSAGVSVTVNANSIDTNHAELNKHLRSSDFLDVNRYPEIKFIGTEYTETKNGEGHLQGELTLHGVTRQVVVVVSHVGAGDDPWGGYRRGFEGSTHIALADYGIKKDLGPAAAELELFVSLEGIKQ